MLLKNKQNQQIYEIRTEGDRHGNFRVYAVPRYGVQQDRSFVMHYRTLKELPDEWEDVD